MDLTHLRTLLAVSETGSLTRAGERVFLSQPAVSAHIKALETEWGVTLFHRTGRGMKLTDAGRELLPLAEDVLHRADAISHAASKLRGEVAGTLTVGLIDCGFDFELARIVARMSHSHASVDLRIIGSNSNAARRSVLDYQLDAAFVEGDFDDPRLEQLRLGTSRVGVIGPAAWRDKLMRADWTTLAEYPWVFQSRDCSYYVLLDQIAQQRHIRPQPRFHAEALGAVKQLVAEGLALSIADLDDAASMEEAGEIFIWPGLEHAMPVWMIARRDRSEEPAIAALLKIAADIHTPTRRRVSAISGA